MKIEKKITDLLGVSLLVLSLALFASACSSSSVEDPDAAEGSESTAEADTANAEIPQEMIEPLPEPTEQQKAEGLDPELPATEQTQVVADEVPTTTAEAPTPAPVVDTTMTSEYATYSVQKGDTLMRISFQIYGDILQWKTLYETNKDRIQNSSRLSVGMELKYPRPANEPSIERNGETYLIKNGDTLASIADDVYGKTSKWRKIWKNNQSLIRDPNKIYAGFYLYYQMTEQERQDAEQIKSQRQQNLGAAPTVDDPMVAPNPPNPEDQTSAYKVPAKNPNMQNAPEGGLQGLIKSNNRVPASVTK